MSDDKITASFLSSSLADVEYPAGGDFFFSKIALAKEIDCAAERAETLIREKFLKEMKEKKDRVDDALAATRAAVEEGIVAGGGVAIVRSAKKLEKLTGENDDEQTGINIIERALEEPLRQIVANAGMEGSVIVSKVKDGKNDFGFNAKSEKFENLMKSGIIDPAKVVRVALQHAASVAGMLLTTECVISDIPEETPPMPPMGGGGMPGMM